MASQTRPFLMTGAALASAAAVVAATPVIAPSIAASPLSVSTSGVNLTTFADIFTIPSSEWVASYFQGYGGIVGPNNPLPLEPWATSCDTQTGPGCYVAGLSGVAYLGLDALINGNGNGWADNANWGVSAVNYFFEGGTPGAGIEYLLQESVGQANPLVGVLITLLFTGPQLVTVVYDNALQLLGNAALSNLPIVGEYVYGAINSYLGPASLDPNFQGYTQGLSGILNYTLDVLTGNAPTPTPAASVAPAAVVAAAPAAAATELARRAVEAVAPAAATTATATTAVADAPSATDAVKDAAKAGASKDEATADTTSAAGTETESTSTTETPATATPAAEATPSADATPAEAPTAATATEDTANASQTTKPADTPVKARKRPVRDAVEKVTKSIGSALGGVKGDKAGDKADAATS